jgi:glutathione synthase
MRFTFVVDPLEGLNACHDTTVSLMEAAQRLGIEVWVTGTSDLALDHDVAVAWARPVQLSEAIRANGRWMASEAWYEAGRAERVPLTASSAVLMRVDPPVDHAYVAATFTLDAAARAGTFVVNDPAGLRNGNEKLLPLLVSDLAPATLVSANETDIREALRRWGLAVAKPLDGMGGRGVVILRDGDASLGALLELVTNCGRRQVVIQEYLPAAADGDKRILLLDGQPVGVINRSSPPGEFRCNMAVGGIVTATELDSRDIEICDRLQPVLRARGLHFVGIDVIGGRLTEVNVTSPTGIREAELLGAEDASDRVVEWIADTAAATSTQRNGMAAGRTSRWPSLSKI